MRGHQDTGHFHKTGVEMVKTANRDRFITVRNRRTSIIMGKHQIGQKVSILTQFHILNSSLLTVHLFIFCH